MDMCKIAEGSNSQPAIWDDESDEEGISEDETTPEEFRSVLKAAEDGDVVQLSRLFNDSNADLVNCRDSDGYTPLHRATYNGHTEAVHFLLEKGANILARTADGWTPLHSAAKWGQTKVASILLSNGAEINSVSKNGVTALHLACEHKNNRPIIELLLYHPLVDLSLKNATGDTARDIATRSGPFYKLFNHVDFVENVTTEEVD